MSGRYSGAAVLVTGAGGFVGSHLVRALVREGANVTALVRPEGDPWRLKDVEPSITVIGQDVTQGLSLRKRVVECAPQIVFHLAARLSVGRGFDAMAGVFAVNLGGTLSLIDAAADIPGCRVVNVGTCDEYGNGPVPFREDQAPRPISPYGASKAAATMAATMVHSACGLAVSTVRPFLTYGPGQVNDMLVPYAIRSAQKGEALELSPGEQTRDFVYVDDVVEGLLLSGLRADIGGEIINLGSGAEVKIRDVVEKIVGILDSKVERRFGALPYRNSEPMRFYSDSTKASRLLGWRTTISLDEGLRRTVSWWRGSMSA